MPTGIEANVSEAGLKDSTEASPVPVSPADADPDGATKVSSPERAPEAVGVNVTFAVHEAEAANGETQLLVWEKSPLAMMLVNARLVVPVLVMTMDCAGLVVPMTVAAKLRLVGLNPTEAPRPVPERETTCGDPAALSAIETWLVRGPGPVGRKVTEIVQLEPTASEDGQLLVCE